MKQFVKISDEAVQCQVFGHQWDDVSGLGRD